MGYTKGNTYTTELNAASLKTFPYVCGVGKEYSDLNWTMKCKYNLKNEKENPENAKKILKLMQLIQVTLSPPSLNYALSSVHKTIDRKIKGKRNRVLPRGTPSLDVCGYTGIWRYITGIP